MDFEFIKIYVCKNDFLLLNYLYSEAPEDSVLSRFARMGCRRKMGIGSNGIISLFPGNEEKYRIKCFTAEGRKTAVCNDALLALSRYAFDSGLFAHNRLTVETEGGPRNITAVDSNNFTVSLGPPFTLPFSLDNGRYSDTVTPKTKGEELREIPDGEFTEKIQLRGKQYAVTPVRLHRNGVVLFSEEFTTEKLKQIARDIRRFCTDEMELLPVFVRVLSREDINIRTWFLSAPVDYVSASAMGGIAGVINGFCDRDIVIHSGLEEYYMQWVSQDNTVHFTASPRYAFSGSYYMEEESL
jgi:diaminopimelate epimerase